MNDLVPSVKAPLVGLGAGALALLSGIDTPLLVLAAFNLGDLASGVMRALINGNLSSRSCFRGALRKFLMWMVVGVAAGLDLLWGGDAVRTVTVTFWVVTEAISILENAAAAGLPVPPALRQALAKAQQFAQTEVEGKQHEQKPERAP